MKIQLMVTGRTRDEALRMLTDKYTARVQRYVPFEVVELPDVRTTKATTEAAQKQAEGAQMLKLMAPQDHVALAGFIDKKMTQLPRNLIFVVGGPYGFSEDVKQRANGLLGLSAMTFSHEMVRPFFVEQIYRAMTILRGEPYHHD